MYWLFWDTMIRRIRIHRDDCGACRKERSTMRSGRDVTYFLGEFPTYLAPEKADELQHRGFSMQGSRIDCGFCHPQRSTIPGVR